MTIDLALFHRTFFEESLEGLSQMESGLLALQQGAGNADVVNAVFRAAHSIKGGASTFGFSTLADLTHSIETLLDEVRDGRRAADPELVDLLLSAVDTIALVLRQTQQGEAIDPAAVAPVREALARKAANAPTSTGSSDSQATGIDRASGLVISFRPHHQLFASGNDPFRLFRELLTLGDCEFTPDASALPPLADMDPESAYLQWHIALRSDSATEAQVAEIFEWVADECDLTIAPSSVAAPVTAAPVTRVAGEPLAPNSPAVAVSAVGTQTGSIRVKTEKIDALINLVGELVITQSMLGEIGQHFDIHKLEALRAGLAQLERNTRELQENVIGIRMVPVGVAFSRFPRLVHDVSRQLGKHVQIVLSGEQTELDKTVIEKISDPLMHLVRNALDHGIEKPDARTAAGKPSQGTLTLNAFHRGGEIFIEVKDDGAGLEKERIRRKAEARGLIAADAAVSDERLFELIFEPGFSTAETISDLSGRGVGMDVVRRNIKELGGAVEVSTRAGLGTTFTIRLPLTLAILDGQLLKVGGRTFVAPLVSMIETVRVKPELVSRVAAATTELYRLRGEYLPVLRPHRLFSLPGAEAPLAESLLMVVEADGRRVGMLVDELTAQQQVVIKSLETNFRPVAGLSGATILGDGAVALILDIAGVIGLGLGSGRDETLASAA